MVLVYHVPLPPGDNPDFMSIHLASSHPSTVPEGDSVDLILSTTGECTDHLLCVWMRNESLLCPPGSGNGSVDSTSQSETKYECAEHRLRIHSVSRVEDSGMYCCEMVTSEGGGLVGRVCLDMEVTYASE